VTYPLGPIAGILYLRYQGKHMNSLTSREREIVLALAEGLSNRKVGRRLNISEGTVKVHLHSIYSKLGVGRELTTNELFAHVYPGLNGK